MLNKQRLLQSKRQQKMQKAGLVVATEVGRKTRKKFLSVFLVVHRQRFPNYGKELIKLMTMAKKQ